MPLLSEGFEAGDLNYYALKGWRGTGATLEQRFVHRDPYGYGGDFGLYVQATGGVYTPKIPETETPRWLNHWWRTTDGDNRNGLDFSFQDTSDTTHITIRILATGYVQIRRGASGGTVIATSSGTLDFSVGHWISVEVVVANSGGVAKVYVDDDPTPFVQYTGDTQNGGRAAWNRVFWATLTYCSCFIDDVIITDVTEGQKSETFLKRLFINGDGTTNWTPSSGSANWPNVQSYDTSSYNYEATATTADLYTVDGNPRLGTVDYVSIDAVMAGKNSFEAQAALKSGATTDYGSLAPITSVYQGVVWQTYWSVDPNTASAWTVAAALAIQVGVRTGS